MADRNHAVIDGYFAAINSKDTDAMLAHFADDAVAEWPQSGEIIRGRALIGQVTSRTPRLPLTLLHRIVGGGDVLVAEWTADYGDGKAWRNASLFELRDGKITRKTDYFGAAFDPPAWRRELTAVEPRPVPVAP